MKKTNKNRVKEFIRVDHAGERGAIKIYEGQLLALNTFIKDDDLKKKIEQMKVHEKEHCDYFENEIRKRNIQTYKISTFMGYSWCWTRLWHGYFRKKSSYVMYSIC